MKKNIFIVLGLVFALLTFYVLDAYISKEKPADGSPSKEEVETVTLSGVVTAVDRGQMMVDGPGLIVFKTDSGESHTIAVPSMGRNLCEAKGQLTDAYEIEVGDMVSVRGDRDQEGRIVPCMSASHYLTASGKYVDEASGISFVYEKGPQGYVLEKIVPTSTDPKTFVEGIILTEYSEYEALKTATDAREGPQTIRVMVYTNPLKQSAPVWAMKNPLLSNIRLTIGEPKEAVVGGANAEHYIADGLYTTDTYVVAHGNSVYVFSGDYMDTASEIYRDFQEFIASVAFIPSPKA